MAGTFSIAYTQQFDTVTGDFLSGGLLYVYDANTSTPSTVYEDSGLTLSQSNPAELDSGGRVPAIWVADGNYRLVLRNSAGVTQFDITSTPAIGTSSSGTSSSSGTTVSADSLLKTGYPLWLPVSGTLTGFVRMNARTISSGSGAGTERANSDCQDLFLYLWTNFSDALCPVGGGRGASAAADWSANKAIAVLDMRGRCPFGLDDMGNSSASVLTAGTPTSAASSGGAEKQTVAQANLPSYNLSTASLTGSVNTAVNVTNGTNQAVVSGGTGTSGWTSGGTGGSVTITAALNSGTVTFGGTLPLGGSGTALTTTPPYRVGSWYIKL